MPWKSSVRIQIQVAYKEMRQHIAEMAKSVGDFAGHMTSWFLWRTVPSSKMQSAAMHCSIPVMLPGSKRRKMNLLHLHSGAQKVLYEFRLVDAKCCGAFLHQNRFRSKSKNTSCGGDNSDLMRFGHSKTQTRQFRNLKRGLMKSGAI